jgi:hypothetical protein
MKIYYGSLLNVALVAAASQLLAQVDVAYAKLSSSSMRRLLPDDRIADHILSESNTHFIIAAEIEDGAAHPDIHVRLSEDAVTEHTIISYDDGSSRRRGTIPRRFVEIKYEPLKNLVLIPTYPLYRRLNHHGSRNSYQPYHGG